jgi:transcriptional accessory protein Tex/SPT6
VLFQKSKGGFSMSQDGELSLLIRGPAHIIENIRLIAESYNDGGYSVRIEVVESTNRPIQLNLDWQSIRPNMEIQGVVTNVRLDGILVNVGLRNKQEFLVRISHESQRSRIKAGYRATLKVISFDRSKGLLDLQLLSTSRP